MNTQEVANALVKYCREGNYEQVYKELYSPNIVSIEPKGAPVEVVEGIDGNSPSRAEFDAQVILKAWNDDGFRGKLEANAQTTVADMMSNYGGAGLPDDVTVNAYFEGAEECVIMLPALSADGEISDDDLENVAGGNPVIVGAIAGAIASKVVDVVWNSASLTKMDRYTSFRNFNTRMPTTGGRRGGGRIRFF